MRQVALLDLVVEPDNFKVYRVVAGQNQQIDLPKLSFELLMYLLNHANQICSVEQISQAVWQNTVVSNETITQRITLLRRALDDDAKQPKYIESVRGRGYRLIVQPVEQAGSPVIRPYVANTKLKWLSLALLLLVLLISLISYWIASQQGHSPAATQMQSTSQASTPVTLLLTRGNYYYSIEQLDNTQRAIELYRQVLNLEPDNQEALTKLSLALSKSVCRYNQAREQALEAKQLALSVLALEGGDNSKSKAQAALAYAWDCLGNLEQALAHYIIAAQLDPNNHASIGSAAHLLETKGELIEAYNLSRQAQQLLPNNHMAELQISRIFELLKFSSQAQSQYHQLFVLYPDNVFINEAYPRFLYFQGRFNEAKSEIEKVLTRANTRYQILLNYAELVWLLEGQKSSLLWFEKAAALSSNESYPVTINQLLHNQLTPQDALTKINQLEIAVAKGESWPINYIEASLLALWAIKDPSLAISYLQKAINSGYLDSEYLNLSPLFAPLKQEPGYFQLIEQINQRREKMHQRFLTLYAPPSVSAEAAY